MDKVRTIIGALLLVCGLLVSAEQPACHDLSDQEAASTISTASSALVPIAPSQQAGAAVRQICDGLSYGQGCPSAFEKQIVVLLNQIRADSGKGSLTMDNRLFRAARCHSEDMFGNGCFKHDDCDGTSWVTRLISFGYTYPFSEVLCSGCTTPEGAISVWMASSTHRQILLDAAYRHIGVGFVGNLWTVDVGGIVSDETVPCLCCVGTTGNVNGSGIVDLADLSALVSYLTGGGYVLPCVPEANVNNAGIVDLADLSALVSYLTAGGYVLLSCP